MTSDLYARHHAAYVWLAWFGWDFPLLAREWLLSKQESIAEGAPRFAYSGGATVVYVLLALLLNLGCGPLSWSNRAVYEARRSRGDPLSLTSRSVDSRLNREKEFVPEEQHTE